MTRPGVSFWLFLVLFLSVGLSKAHDDDESEHDDNEEWHKKPSDVIDLTDTSFAAALETNKVILIEFYAPWCGHCKHLAPEYALAATTLKAEGIPVARIDGSAHQAQAVQHNVRGFPTLLLFINGSPIAYNGRRDSESIVQFVHAALQPAFVPLHTKEEVDKFVAGNSLTVIASFGDLQAEGIQELKAAFESVATELHVSTSVVFGEFDGEDGGVIGATRKAPVLVARQPDFDAPIEFDFLVDGQPSEAMRSPQEISRWIASATMPAFAQISGENFQRYVDAGLPIVWAIVDPKQEKFDDFQAWMRTIAREQRGKLSFVWLDHTVFPQQTKVLGLSGDVLPTVAITDGRRKFALTDQEASALTVESFRGWLAKYLEGKLEVVIRSEPIPDAAEYEKNPVKDVVGKNFPEMVLESKKDVLVEFYATWCGHCQALAPIYEEVGKLLAPIPSVVIARVNVPENDIPDIISVSGFPTLMLFRADNKEPVEYQGSRSLGDLIKFVHKEASVKFDLPAEVEAIIKQEEAKEQEEEQEEEAAEERHDKEEL